MQKNNSFLAAVLEVEEGDQTTFRMYCRSQETCRCDLRLMSLFLAVLYTYLLRILPYLGKYIQKSFDVVATYHTQ